MLQGQVDAIGTFYELQSRGMNLDQIIFRTHSELEEDELERPHSESEVVKLLSRSESSNSHPFKRRESDAYKCSISEVSWPSHCWNRYESFDVDGIQSSNEIFKVILNYFSNSNIKG